MEKQIADLNIQLDNLCQFLPQVRSTHASIALCRFPFFAPSIVSVPPVQLSRWVHTSVEFPILRMRVMR